MKKLFFILLLFLPLVLFAQMRPMGPNPFIIPMDKIIYEVVSLSSDNYGKSKIAVSIKAPYEFLVFTRSPERTSKDFIGSFDISIEIFDKDMNSIDRKIKQEILELNSEEKKLLHDKFYEASFNFDVNPGDYKIIIELNDRESDKSVRKEIKSFKAKDYKSKTISDISFLQQQNDSLNLSNFSNNVSFGENTLIYAEMSGYDPNQDKLNLKIIRINEKKRDSVFSIDIPSENIYKKSHDNTHNNSKDLNLYTIKFPLKTDTLEISKYELLIEDTQQSKVPVSKKEFEVVWYKMPFSLRDFDMAQKQLKLITNEKEFDELRSGSKTVQREKFLEFWKKKDPTPNTLYNELMTEFFKRVDFAMMNYSSVQTPDGSETDRGKTYILYGKPDNVDRKLIPNEAPVEVWSYTKLSKKYIFIDESRQGNYKLASIEKE